MAKSPFHHRTAEISIPHKPTLPAPHWQPFPSNRMAVHSKKPIIPPHGRNLHSKQNLVFLGQGLYCASNFPNYYYPCLCSASLLRGHVPVPVIAVPAFTWRSCPHSCHPVPTFARRLCRTRLMNSVRVLFSIKYCHCSWNVHSKIKNVTYWSKS